MSAKKPSRDFFEKIKKEDVDFDEILAGEAKKIEHHDHPSTELLLRFLGDSLSLEKSSQVSAHLATCPICSEEIESLKQEVRELSETIRPEVSIPHQIINLLRSLSTRLKYKVNLLLQETFKPKVLSVPAVAGRGDSELRALSPRGAVRTKEELKFRFSSSMERVETYKIFIYDNETYEIITEIQSDESPVKYPKNAPHLQPGKKYGWYVQAIKEGKRVKQDGYTFHLLTESDRRRLEKDLKQVGKRTIQEKNGPTRLVLGTIYESLELYSKAIKEYEKKVRMDPSDPVGYERLGKVYEAQGLMNKADQNFKKANELRKSRGDLPVGE